VVAAYADNLIIMGKLEDQVKNTANKLIQERKSIELVIVSAIG